ncbi:helix-turn-helix transcriptional regulator [Kitasatospora sp. NPDC087314]|uniref:helix-turn-helix transcriptional regulator n=1 Tax=Kitasatospora sp. NPDC087314 TaxID=3364068 RepID=UPI00380487B9
MDGEKPTSVRTRWTFVTNHARVLTAIERDSGVRLRDVARVCRLTERAVQSIVADLEQAGYLTHTRSGRRNHYSVTSDTPLRHPADNGVRVAALLDVLARAHPGLDTNADSPPKARPHSGAGPDAPGAPAVQPSDHRQ